MYRAHNRNKYHHVYSAHCQTGLLRLAFDLCHPERERACYVIREIPPGAGLSVLITLPAF